MVNASDAASAVRLRLRPHHPSVRRDAEPLCLRDQPCCELEEDEELQPVLDVPFQPHVQPPCAQVVEHRLGLKRIAPPVHSANPRDKRFIDSRLPPPIRYSGTCRRVALGIHYAYLTF